MVTAEAILVADEAWVALASLHRRYPARDSFSASEIMESAKREKAHSEVPSGLQPHIYLHNVANVAPNSARHRMFFKIPGGAYRLFRPGDNCHPERKKKIVPRREDLPVQYHPLLDWYEKDYAHLSTLRATRTIRFWGCGASEKRFGKRGATLS
jgi:hypothetical protein